MPEDDVKSLRPFYVKHLILIKVGIADPRVILYSFPICNKMYISKPKNKEIGSVSRKTDSLMSSFLLPVFLAEFPSGAWVLTMYTYLPWFSSSTREGAQGGSPSDIQVASVAQRRWCKFHVLEFYWFPM